MKEQYISPSRTKYGMPEGTLLLYGDFFFIYLRMCDKVIVPEYGYSQETFQPVVILYSCDDMQEIEIDFYNFIQSIQQGDVIVYDSKSS